MIISHRHRFIFFAVPKTATHSIREALRVYKASEDWEQQTLFGRQALPIAELAKIQHGHISVQEIAPWLAQEQWQSYLKLAFVRNPFDRFVSACAFLNRGNPRFASHPLLWMKAAMQREPFKQRVLIRPQSQQLCDAQGKLCIDMLGRYETLQQSLDQMLVRLNLPAVNLKVKNRSSHADYQHYFDASLRQQLEDFYAQDLALFNYTF